MVSIQLKCLSLFTLVVRLQIRHLREWAHNEPDSFVVFLYVFWFTIGVLSVWWDCGVDYPGRSLVCDYEGRVIEDAGVFEGGLEWGCEVEDVVGGVEEMRERWGLVKADS